MKRSLVYIFFFAILINLAGCLTFETKEYSYKLKDGTSGSGKIKYINIMRTFDSLTTRESEYTELINTYLKGTKPEDEMLGVKNVKKRLFEEDNQLCGEITFDFDDIKSLKFFNYNGKVWTYSLSSNNIFGGSEQFFSSNGTYGGEFMQVIFWNGNEEKFEFKTITSQKDKKNEGLLDLWKSKGEN